QNTLALRRQDLDPNHYQIGINEGSIAEALLGLGRYEEAMSHVVEAERIFDRSVPPRATQMWLRTIHGEVLVGQRQLSSAVPMLEQALALSDETGDRVNFAQAAWALARALHGLGKDAHRVRQLAEQARDAFASLGPAERTDHDAVQQFIDRLPSILP